MLNTSAATDARHSRSGKDAMLYNADGVPFAQVAVFSRKHLLIIPNISH